MTTALSITGVFGWALLTLPYVVLLWAVVAMRVRSGQKSLAPTRGRSSRTESVQRAFTDLAVEAPERSGTKQESASLFETIQDIENRGSRNELPSLYLKLGSSLRAEGAESKALEALAHSVSIAIETKDLATQARGRLELGDIAAESGDIATACEHWMIARNVFKEVDDTKQSDATEQRMRESNCPTEWVLTQF